MKLSDVTLEQFRSFHALQLSLSPDVTILLGENGAGKTNILEAISWLSLNASCLGAENEDAIRWGSSYFRVRGSYVSDSGERGTLEVAAQSEPRRDRRTFINDVRTPHGRFKNFLPVVSFFPWDLDLFTGAPAHRRTFVDGLLQQTSSAFREHAETYDDVLKQRNALLKRIAAGTAPESELAVWDAALAASGAVLRQERRQLFDGWQRTMKDTVHSLDEHPSDVTFVLIKKGEAAAREDLEAELLSHLTHYRPRDIILQTTSVGPHRDDWDIRADGHALATFASRGQQRAYLLALLFHKVAALHEARDERPLILLDDVFSELDDAHQEALLSRLADHQVLISTTHLPPHVPAHTVTLAVSEGRVREDAGQTAVERERERVGGIVG